MRFIQKLKASNLKILFLSQYYPPEIGAPQNRLSELAILLNKKTDVNVDVLTAMPNYPEMIVHRGYRNKFYHKETINGLTIHRSYIFCSKSKSIILRLLNYFSFVFTSFIVGALRLKKYDVILCESPPLFLGLSAYSLAKIKGSKFIFNVSDLWPESAEKLRIISNKFLLNTATLLEEFLYKKANLITGQTMGIVNNIKSRFSEKNIYWLPNGIDINKFSPKKDNTWRTENEFKNDDFLFLYAGIHGHAQGLEVILNAASQIESDKIHFILLGTGPLKSELIEIKQKLGVDNVHFYNPVKKEEMPDIISSVNCSIIPLKKLDLFLGAIPSKIFEILAMQKPVILGVDGEAKKLFVDHGKCALFFEPENHLDLKNQIINIYSNKSLYRSLVENSRSYICEYFDRSKIADDFYRVLKLNFSEKHNKP